MIFGPSIHPLAAYLAFFALAACTLAACNAPASDEGGSADTTTMSWQPLFDGTSLDGWHKVSGGKFYVQDGLLVGEVTQNGGYLATDRSYDNFVMEADVKINKGDLKASPDLNSGIQVRGWIREQDTTMSSLSGDLERAERTWEAGRITGYQIEVDPSERAWSGGLYEPVGRGWLQPVTDDKEAQQAFKIGEWNTYRIKVKGDSIQTWVNGVPVVNTIDTVHTEGFIALQSHSAHSKKEAGKKVYWRNLRVRPLN
jgi:hypothetical protein